MTTNKRGGKRPGAGRRPVNPKEPTAKVSVTLLRSHIEWLQKLGPTISEAIRRIVEKEMNQ